MSIRVGILGAAGYTGGELIRLLVHHPCATIRFAHSESSAGKRVQQVHEGLAGDTDLVFTDQLPLDEVDVLFLCFGHGKSRQWISEHQVPEGVKIIDLAQDFRLAAADHDFVYGLPEIHRDSISSAMHVANPGCFATAIQLALLPLAADHLLCHDVSVNAITGATGAGQKPTPTSHFAWRDNNLSIYKVFTHQHLHEIRQSLTELQGSLPVSIDFIPYRGNFPRGIFCTCVVRFDGEEGTATHPSLAQLEQRYTQFYAPAPFTHYVPEPLDLKQVVNTNKALLHIDKFDNKIVITSVIDNLLKGAVGQAVENMNLLFALPQDTGLRLKASAF